MPQFSVTGGDVAPLRSAILNGMEAIVVASMTSMKPWEEPRWRRLLRAHRARRRRAKLRLKIDLHEDDLRHCGYEGAASTDRTLQAEAVTLFLTVTLGRQ